MHGKSMTGQSFRAASRQVQETARCRAMVLSACMTEHGSDFSTHDTCARTVEAVLPHRYLRHVCFWRSLPQLPATWNHRHGRFKTKKETCIRYTYVCKSTACLHHAIMPSGSWRSSFRGSWQLVLENDCCSSRRLLMCTAVQDLRPYPCNGNKPVSFRVSREPAWDSSCRRLLLGLLRR